MKLGVFPIKTLCFTSRSAGTNAESQLGAGESKPFECLVTRRHGAPPHARATGGQHAHARTLRTRAPAAVVGPTPPTTATDCVPSCPQPRAMELGDRQAAPPSSFRWTLASGLGSTYARGSSIAHSDPQGVQRIHMLAQGASSPSAPPRTAHPLTAVPPPVLQLAGRLAKSPRI